MDFEVLESVYQDIQLATSNLGVSMLSLCLQIGRSGQVQAISKVHSPIVHRPCPEMLWSAINLHCRRARYGEWQSERRFIIFPQIWCIRFVRKSSIVLSYEPWAQTSSHGCMLLEIPTDPPKKVLGYVTLARNMPMPTPCFLVRLRYAGESCLHYDMMLLMFENGPNITDVCFCFLLTFLVSLCAFYLFVFV